MNYIAVATTTKDQLAAGRIPYDPETSNLTDIKRRVTRMPTLDGSSAFIDSGYTDADRTIRVVLDTNATQAQLDLCRWLCVVYDTILLFLPDGAYRASPQSVTGNGSSYTFTLLLQGAARIT